MTNSSYHQGAVIMERPDGHYALGLFNSTIAANVGVLISRMTHIEERFTALLAILAGCDSATARLIFRSLQSDPPRLAILRSLTTKLSDLAQRKTYIKAIEEFEAIKKIRNSYTHGYWQTHIETDRAFLTTDLKQQHPISRGEEVLPEAVSDLIIRANMLEWELLKLEHPRIADAPANQPAP